MLANGQSNVEVKISSNDEVGKLAINFNKMSKNIAASIQQINQKTKEAEEAAQSAKLSQKNRKKNLNIYQIVLQKCYPQWKRLQKVI